MLAYYIPFLLSVAVIKIREVDIVFNISGAVVMTLLFIQELI